VRARIQAVAALLAALLLVAAPLSCQAALTERRAEGLLLRYPQGRQASAIRFLAAWWKARGRVRKLTGAALRQPVTVELLPDYQALVERTRSLTGFTPDEWIQGLAFGKKRLILIRLDARGTEQQRVEGLLVHELSHIATNEYRRLPKAAPIPRWFDEGLAQYVAGQTVTQLFWKLSLRARVGALIPFKNLDQALLEPGGRRAQAYVQAESFVAFLAQESRGPRALRNILELLGAGIDLNTAVKNETLRGLGEEERRWERALKNNIGATLLSLAPLGFALFLLVTTGLILLRNARRREQILARWAAEEEHQGAVEISRT